MINPCDSEPGMFWANETDTIAADALGAVSL